MIISGHLLDLQMLAPDPRNQRLQLMGWLRRVMVGRLSVVTRELRVAVEAAVGQTAAAGRALQFAAGGFWQRPRIEQYDHAWCLLAGFGHGLANGCDQGVRRHDFLHAAADFGGNADPLLAFDIDRERRHTAFAHHFDFTLEGGFDVLRVEVMAAHDQQVFQASGDVQLAFMDKTQVAGAQPCGALMCNKCLGAGVRVAPVAVGDARPAGPDFTDTVIRQGLERVWVDDLHRMLRLLSAAAHHRAAVARHDAVVGQLQLIQVEGRDALPALPACDKQGGFGQAIGGEIAGRVKTAQSKFFGETYQGVLADRLRA